MIIFLLLIPVIIYLIYYLSGTAEECSDFTKENKCPKKDCEWKNKKCKKKNKSKSKGNDEPDDPEPDDPEPHDPEPDDPEPDGPVANLEPAVYDLHDNNRWSENGEFFIGGKLTRRCAKNGPAGINRRDTCQFHVDTADSTECNRDRDNVCNREIIFNLEKKEYVTDFIFDLKFAEHAVGVTGKRVKLAFKITIGDTVIDTGIIDFMGLYPEWEWERPDGSSMYHGKIKDIKASRMPGAPSTGIHEETSEIIMQITVYPDGYEYFNIAFNNARVIVGDEISNSPVSAGEETQGDDNAIDFTDVSESSTINILPDFVSSSVYNREYIDIKDAGGNKMTFDSLQDCITHAKEHYPGYPVISYVNNYDSSSYHKTCRIFKPYYFRKGEETPHMVQAAPDPRRTLGCNAKNLTINSGCLSKYDYKFATIRNDEADGGTFVEKEYVLNAAQNPTNNEYSFDPNYDNLLKFDTVDKCAEHIRKYYPNYDDNGKIFIYRALGPDDSKINKTCGVVTKYKYNDDNPLEFTSDPNIVTGCTIPGTFLKELCISK